MDLVVKSGSNCFKVLSMCKIFIQFLEEFDKFLFFVDMYLEMELRNYLKRFNIILFSVFRGRLC